MSSLGRPGPPGRGPVQRRAMSNGTALFLIAVGAILWLAVSGTAIPGVNVNIVGVILLLVGLVGLLLPMAAGGSRRPSGR